MGWAAAAAAVASAVAGAFASKGSGAKGADPSTTAGGGGFLSGMEQSANVLGNGAPKVESETLGDPLPGNTGAPTGPITLGSSREVEDVKKPLGARLKSAGRKTNEWLGSDIGLLGQNVGGQFLSDFRQQRNTKKHQDFLKGEGLNPFEAATGARGVAQVPSTSVGQGPTSVSRAHPSQRKSAHEIDKIMSETERIELDMVRMRIENENYFPLKLAGMGPENMKAALAVFNSGLSPEMILKAAGDQTAEQRAAGERLLARFLEITGDSGGAIGWIELIRHIIINTASFGKRGR